MFSFKSFLKALVFLFSLLIIIIIFSGISYFVIDKVQTKNNLMDIEEYSPISTLVVPQNPSKKSKYPFVDVHSHHWDMPIADLSGLVNEMDSLNMGYMINLSGSGFATFAGNQTLMDLNLSKSLENVKENYPNRFGIFVNLDLNKIDNDDVAKSSVEILENGVKEGAIGLKIYKNLGLNLKDSKGVRVSVDDKRLSPIGEACGNLKIPV